VIPSQTDINALRKGSSVLGVVSNIADFGAFVDIGLKNDGMTHISEMSQKRIKHPLEVLSINQYLARVEAIRIDLEKDKVGFEYKRHVGFAIMCFYEFTRSYYARAT